MESKRQQKVAKLIQKELSEVFQRDLSALLQGAFVTFTTVRVTPDLALATVYTSVMMAKDRNAIIAHLQENHNQIRYQLGLRVKNQLRIVPEIRFFLDDTADEADKIDKLLKGIHIPPVDPDDVA